MSSRPLAILLLVLTVVTAAAGGSYLATRHNVADTAVSAAAPAPQAAAAPVASASVPAPAPVASAQPVAETEAAVTSAVKQPTAVVPSVKAPGPRREEARVASLPPAPKPRAAAATPKPAPAGRTTPMTSAPATSELSVSQAAVPPPAPEPARPIEPQPEAPRVPQFEELILPASSVIGLQIESTLSSERARVEDRVDARVTRDVLAAGRLAIPAGSRVLGSVTAVDRGGKVKERARLGVRFHTLILADGSEVPLHTDAVYREGESPTADSAKKIGGAAIGGAILGAILGGKKGAAIGGATGAAGGTAAVMQGDRHAATLTRGEVVTAKLSSPATITVERRE